MTLAAVLERSKTERESWRYTDLEKLLATMPKPPAKACPPQDVQTQGLRLVFADGVLSQEQSQFLGLPTNILTGDAKKGYRLEVQKETCLITQPLELLFTSAGAVETATKLHIELGRSARLTVIERHENSPTTHVFETTICLHEQAKLVHGKLIQSGGDAAHLAQTKVQVAEGAYYDNFVLIKDCKLTRNEMDVSLDGKMAQCNLNGAMLMRGHEHADTTTRITHAAPHGTSREIYKSVLAEQARAVFQGKILVKEDAQKTDGHQLSRALLLSDQAEMDVKPELEIYADDVKCSHGSTIGDLDDQAMFYLRARGLNEKEARGLLIQAFVGEILDEIHADGLRDLCRSEIEGWLHDQI